MASAWLSPSISGVRKFSRFLAYSAEASAASRPGTFTWPTMVTPWAWATSPGLEPTTLPPCSTARSTITLPGFMDATISSVTSVGAGRPGIRAVVMTMSCFFRVSATSSAWRRL